MKTDSTMIKFFWLLIILAVIALHVKSYRDDVTYNGFKGTYWEYFVGDLKLILKG
jgi:hypothetical protein